MSYHHRTDTELWNSLNDATLSERSEILQSLGLRFIQRDEHNLAIAVLEEAKDAYEQLGCSSDVRVCGNWIARCHSNLGDSHNAIEGHKQVLASLIDNDPSNKWVGMTLDAIGCEYRDIDMHQLALDWFAQAARQHRANGDDELAVNSARKWLTAIRRTQRWNAMAEAAELVLALSTDIDDHIHARVGQILARLAGESLDVDVAAHLAKCDRLASTTSDPELAFEVELAHIAAMRARGDLEHAAARALQGQQAARAVNARSHQAEFMMQAAASFATTEPERAEELLLTAHDLAEVIGDQFIQDLAQASLMELRDGRGDANVAETDANQPPLW